MGASTDAGDRVGGQRLTASRAGPGFNRFSISQPILEVILCAVVLSSLAYVAAHFLAFGGLPRPLPSDPSQSLMDLYNTAYWANRDGAYDIWHTVYPPLSLIFAQAISRQACYATTPFDGRACDPGAAWFILAFYLLNIALVFLALWRSDRKTAAPRTLALCFGLPMLYALDFANLIIPCFTFFILAHGRLVRSRWLRHLFSAVAFNFKLYLLVVALPFALQRRVRWVLSAAAAFLVVYLVTLAIYGSGTPWQLLQDLLYYSRVQSGLFLEDNRLPAIARASGDAWAVTMPLVLRLGEGVALLALLAGIRSRGAVDRRRLAALALSVLCTEAALHTQGFSADYTQVFLLFLLFLEREWRPATAFVTVLAYLLCISGDFTLVHAETVFRAGYFSGSEVRVDFGLTASQFVRPLLIVLIQIGLAWMIVRKVIDRRPARIAQQPPALPVG